MKWSHYSQDAKLLKSSWLRHERKILFLFELAWELKLLDFSVVHQCLEKYVNPIDNPLKNLGKNVHVKNLGKNVHMPRPPDSHIPDHWICGRLPFQTNLEVKNAGLILLKNVLFNYKNSQLFSFLWNIW